MKLSANTSAGQIITCFSRFFTSVDWLFEDRLFINTSINLSLKRLIIFKVIYFNSKLCFNTRKNFINNRLTCTWLADHKYRSGDNLFLTIPHRCRSSYWKVNYLQVQVQVNLYLHLWQSLEWTQLITNYSLNWNSIKHLLLEYTYKSHFSCILN